MKNKDIKVSERDLLNDFQMQEVYMNTQISDAVVLALWAYNWNIGFINDVPWPKGNFSSLSECRSYLKREWLSKQEGGMTGCKLAIDFFLDLDSESQDTLIKWYRETL